MSCINSIQTFSGKTFDILNPESKNVDITDIAHALSFICRFNGHCRIFYSVAQHAVFVAHIVKKLGYDESYQFYALHHDDSEYVCCDIPKPIKPLITNYKEIEYNVSKTIYESLGLNFNDEEKHKAMKKADNIALATEVRDLMANPTDIITEAEPFPEELIPISSEMAEKHYLHFHKYFCETLGKP